MDLNGSLYGYTQLPSISTDSNSNNPALILWARKKLLFDKEERDKACPSK
jgi:hypothetical protein